MKHSNPGSVIEQSNRCDYGNLTTSSTVTFTTLDKEEVELYADMFTVVSVLTMRKFQGFSSDNVIQKSYAIREGKSILLAIPTPDKNIPDAWSVMVFIAEGETADGISEAFKKATKPYIKNSIDTIRDLQEWGVRHREQMVINNLPPELRSKLS